MADDRAARVDLEREPRTVAEHRQSAPQRVLRARIHPGRGAPDHGPVQPDQREVFGGVEPLQEERSAVVDVGLVDGRERARSLVEVVEDERRRRARVGVGDAVAGGEHDRGCDEGAGAGRGRRLVEEALGRAEALRLLERERKGQGVPLAFRNERPLVEERDGRAAGDRGELRLHLEELPPIVRPVDHPRDGAGGVDGGRASGEREPQAEDEPSHVQRAAAVYSKRKRTSRTPARSRPPSPEVAHAPPTSHTS